MSSFDTFTFLAAVAAGVFVVYRFQQAIAQEKKVDESTTTRYPEYRPASHLFWNPLLVTRVYKDGPLSWVGEDSSGRKWVAYSGQNTPPEFFKLNATPVDQTKPKSSA